MYYNIRIEMLKNGISIDTLALFLGIHRNTLSKKLNGKAKLSTDELQAIKDNFFPNLSLDLLAKKDSKND